MNHSHNLVTDFWIGKEGLLIGMCSSLLLADILLLVTFIYKVYIQKNFKVFGNKKTTSFLDKTFISMLTILAIQGLTCIIMSFNYKKPASGMKCSVQNLIFTLLHSTLKVFFFAVTFQFHYIWVEQRLLNHLHPSHAVQQAIRLVFVFLFSFCIVTAFQMNIGIVFIAQDSFCYGKRVVSMISWLNCHQLVHYQFLFF